MNTSTKLNQVAEYQGLYGPVVIPEAVIQGIWHNRQFQQTNLKSLAGQKVGIVSPGRWNHHEGPDFTEAVLNIDGKKIIGDIEIHLYAKDWYNHGHHLDPNFNNVILHVLAFPPGSDYLEALTIQGKSIDGVVLLPHLDSDLESYANELALMNWQRRDQFTLLQNFLNLTPIEQQQNLIKDARLRYEQKVFFASKRLQRFDWQSCCHQYTLEILGYSRNRAVMSDLALKVKPREFTNHSVDHLYNLQGERWKLNGLRPPNQPRNRLAQYHHLLSVNPGWTNELLKLEKLFASHGFDEDTLISRKTLQINRLADSIRHHVLVDSIGGSRFNTWMVDAAIPLLAAQLDENLFPYWFHWQAGDITQAVKQFISDSQIIRPPFMHCNGVYQGVLHFLINVV